MDDVSKQYTAFTLGSMGLYECESMPFGLCNAPPTFQRLMQNCLSELNLTYCLIYLDDMIVFSETPEEHLLRIRVVFNRLRQHGLKLKPSKCDVFKSEMNYLAHHVSKEGGLTLQEKLGVNCSMSATRHLHQCEVFHGPRSSLQALHKGLCQNCGTSV